MNGKDAQVDDFLTFLEEFDIGTIDSNDVNNSLDQVLAERDENECNENINDEYLNFFGYSDDGDDEEAFLQLHSDEYETENVLVNDNEENNELDLDLLDLEDIENTDLFDLYKENEI